MNMNEHNHKKQRRLSWTILACVSVSFVLNVLVLLSRLNVL